MFNNQLSYNTLNNFYNDIKEENNLTTNDINKAMNKLQLLYQNEENGKLFKYILSSYTFIHSKKFLIHSINTSKFINFNSKITQKSIKQIKNNDSDWFFDNMKYVGNTYGTGKKDLPMDTVKSLDKKHLLEAVKSCMYFYNLIHE